MKALFKNRLLLISLGLLAFYWTVAPMIDRPYVRNTMSLLSLLAGVLMLNRYAYAAYCVLVLQDRNDKGAHYAILGASTASIGIIWSGIFSILWVYFGQPKEWTATATSSFGSGLIAIGFWLMTISPDTPRIGFGYPIGFGRVVLAVFALVLAFIAGTNFASI